MVQAKDHYTNLQSLHIKPLPGVVSTCLMVIMKEGEGLTVNLSSDDQFFEFRDDQFSEFRQATSITYTNQSAGKPYPAIQNFYIAI